MLRLHVPRNRILAEKGENRIVHITLRGAEERESQIPDDDHGNQVRQQDQALVQSGHELISNLVEENGDADRQKGRQSNEHPVIQKRIPGNDIGVRRFEEKLEVVEAGPRAAEDPLRVVHLLERDQETGHRHIVVDR